MREAFAEAKELFAEASTQSRFNRLVEDIVGPLLVLSDGGVVQKEAAPNDIDSRWGLGIAGGGFEPPTDCGISGENGEDSGKAAQIPAHVKPSSITADADLADLLRNWSRIQPAVRAAILALVKAALQ